MQLVEVFFRRVEIAHLFGAVAQVAGDGKAAHQRLLGLFAFPNLRGGQQLHRVAKAPLRGIGVGQVQPNHHIQVGVFRALLKVRLVFLQKAVHVELVIQPVELAAVRVRGVDVLRGGDEQTADNQHQDHRNRVHRRLEQIERRHQRDKQPFKQDQPRLKLGKEGQHRINNSLIYSVRMSIVYLDAAGKAILFA